MASSFVNAKITGREIRRKAHFQPEIALEGDWREGRISPHSTRLFLPLRFC
jgi:hypothetical protein